MPSLFAISSSCARILIRGPRIRPSCPLRNGYISTQLLRPKHANAASSRASAAQAARSFSARASSATPPHAKLSAGADFVSAARFEMDTTTKTISKLMENEFSDVEVVEKPSLWTRRTYAGWIRVVGTRLCPQSLRNTSLLRVVVDGVIVAGASLKITAR